MRPGSKKHEKIFNSSEKSKTQISGSGETQEFLKSKRTNPKKKRKRSKKQEVIYIRTSEYPIPKEATAYELTELRKKQSKFGPKIVYLPLPTSTKKPSLPSVKELMRCIRPLRKEPVVIEILPKWEYHLKGYLFGAVNIGKSVVSNYRNLVDVTTSFLHTLILMVALNKYNPANFESIRGSIEWIIFLSFLNNLLVGVDVFFLLKFGRNESKIIVASVVMDCVFYFFQWIFLVFYKTYFNWPINILMLFIDVGVSRKTDNVRSRPGIDQYLKKIPLNSDFKYLRQRPFLSLLRCLVWSRLLGGWRPHWLATLFPLTLVFFALLLISLGLVIVAILSFFIKFNFFPHDSEVKYNPLIALAISAPFLILSETLFTGLALLQTLEEKGEYRPLFFILLLLFGIGLLAYSIKFVRLRRYVIFPEPAHSFIESRMEHLLAENNMDNMMNSEGFFDEEIVDFQDFKHRVKHLIRFFGIRVSLSSEIMTQKYQKAKLEQGCCFCFEGGRNGMVMPCKHAGFCSACAEAMMREGGVCKVPGCGCRIKRSVQYLEKNGKYFEVTGAMR